MNKPDNKSDPERKSGQANDQQFWRAMRQDTPANANEEPVELSTDIKDLNDEERDHRRRALRSMLAASEARQKQMLRSRPPTMAAGVRVGIKSGPHKHKLGVIQDADYIHSRALIVFDHEPDGHWVEFARITSDDNIR